MVIFIMNMQINYAYLNIIYNIYYYFIWYIIILYYICLLYNIKYYTMIIKNHKIINIIKGHNPLILVEGKVGSIAIKINNFFANELNINDIIDVDFDIKSIGNNVSLIANNITIKNFNTEYPEIVENFELEKIN